MRSSYVHFDSVERLKFQIIRVPLTSGSQVLSQIKDSIMLQLRQEAQEMGNRRKTIKNKLSPSSLTPKAVNNF